MRRRLLLVVVLLLAAGVSYLSQRDAGVETTTSEPRADGIEALFAAQRSGVVVESEGRVSRILPDDNEGSRHQRFVLELASGHTVLISHNIDLAPRVPLGRDDVVSFRGQYEWNDRGGVVHWTHHDPKGRRPGGWIRWRAETFR